MALQIRSVVWGLLVTVAVAQRPVSISTEDQAAVTVYGDDLTLKNRVTGSPIASITGILAAIAAVNNTAQMGQAQLSAANAAALTTAISGLSTAVQTTTNANAAAITTAVAGLSTAVQTTTNANAAAITTAVAGLSINVTSVNQTATFARQTASLNGVQFANINSQMTEQLNFTGAAAPLATTMAMINQLAANLSRANAMIASIERGSLVTCQATCVNGVCVTVSNDTHSRALCRCRSPYIGAACDQTASPTFAPTPAPTLPPTRPSVSSCASATSSGTYRITSGGGFDAYCLVSGSQRWMRILHWDGSLYSMTTSASRPDSCAVARASGFCKLSDAQINSVIPRGRSRYYYLDTPEFSQNMYIQTNRAYQDTAGSWGCGAGTSACVGIVSNSLPVPFRGTTMRYSWIDFLHVRNGAYSQGQGCQRYFLGHGNHDCYAVGNNRRCIRGGASCGNHRYIRTWDMYMSVA